MPSPGIGSRPLQNTKKEPEPGDLFFEGQSCLWSAPRPELSKVEANERTPLNKISVEDSRNLLNI